MYPLNASVLFWGQHIVEYITIISETVFFIIIYNDDCKKQK